MTTELQMKANTQNAQLSTGPLSLEGKQIVSRNAIKHGIFAKDLVINSGDGRENLQEYQELLSDLRKDLKPVGRMESILVEKIAVNYWRLRRMVRYETGAIRGGLDEYRESVVRSQNQWAYRHLELEYYSYSDEISDIAFQQQQLKVELISSPSFDPAVEQIAWEYVLRGRFHKMIDDPAEEDLIPARKYVAGLSPQMRGKLRKEMLEEAENILAEMEKVRALQIKFDRTEKEKSLPALAHLNKVIKYENSLEGSIFKNLAALRSLQQCRDSERRLEKDGN